jgi:hypothetical protein
MDFFKGNKIHSIPSAEGKYRCQPHVVIFYGMLKNPSKYE